MWEGVTESLGLCGGGGIPGMTVGSQWCSWAARVYRAAVMMCLACPSRTMWRSALKSFVRWAVGWTMIRSRARWLAFFPPSSACDCLSLGCVGAGVLVRAVQGRGLYPVQGDAVFSGPVGQNVYARVPWYGALVHVARDGGGRERLAQGRGARGGAGRVFVFTSGLVDAVWGDVYGEGSNGGL